MYHHAPYDDAICYVKIIIDDPISVNIQATMNKSTILKVGIQGFKYKSYTKVFPLQQNAFDFIDGTEERSTTVKDENGDLHKKDEAFVDKEQCLVNETKSLLFSLEPILFAFE